MTNKVECTNCKGKFALNEIYKNRCPECLPEVVYFNTVLKVYVRACGESSYCTNALEFNTVKAAQDYGNNLLSRWFGADRFVMIRVPATDAPNRIAGDTAQTIQERI